MYKLMFFNISSDIRLVSTMTKYKWIKALKLNSILGKVLAIGDYGPILIRGRKDFG